MIIDHSHDDEDTRYMRRAIAQAELGMYTTTPNPRVGCVIVRSGEIVGEGFHEKAGQPHAEVHALAQAGERAKGATAYVTLEPCSHFGRTPPCADTLVRAGVARVVAANVDPNPEVAGQGLARLRAAGIQTEQGLLDAEAAQLNPGFFKRMRTGTPWMRLKAAISLDGRTALANGQSQWITSEASRQDGHHWRARACAILTGIGTVRDDDPLMNVRGLQTPRQPVKVIVDSRLEIDPNARILKEGRTLVVHALGEETQERSPGIGLRHPATALHLKAQQLRESGAELVALPGPNGKVDLNALMSFLGQCQFNEVHVEAGSKLNGSLLQSGCIDELLIYQAPVLLGDGPGLAALPVFEALNDGHRFTRLDTHPLGQDIRMRFMRVSR